MKSLEQVLTQYKQCAYMKKQLGHTRDRNHLAKENYMETLLEGNQLKVKESPLAC